MLHAELHGKTDVLASKRERGEDLLTSTVFGTLLIANAVAELAAWLRRARRHGDERALEVPPVDAVDYWFWPRLREAEPDVLIAFGKLLVIVEAKYYAKKHGSGTAEVDQLGRQWRSCDAQVDTRGYPARLGEAIRGCESRVVVYLVLRRNLAKAREEVAESLQHEPQAAMYVLAWEDLDEVLGSADRGWKRDLCEFLVVRRLTAFRSFRRVMSARPGRDLARWSLRGEGAVPWPKAFSPESGPRLAALASKGSRFNRATTGWGGSFSRGALGALAALGRRPTTFDRGGHGG